MFCQDSSLYRHVFTVLPKFEVKLDVPSALHYEDILTGTVTAKWAIVLYSSLIIYIYIYALVFTFLSALAFPGIQPMILALLAHCSTIWATGKLII